MKKILFIYGTRPEAIKMAPLIKTMDCYEDNFQVHVCSTGQHREMLMQVNEFFNIMPDFELDLMEPDQSLSHFMSKCMSELDQVLEQVKPDMVFVQGDTSSVVAGALAAFYRGILVSHLEAGLRTRNKYSPFPEEMNRRVTSQISDFHFAPTESAVENLKHENISNRVYLVGNTVIDALYMALSLTANDDEKFFKSFSNIDFKRKIILVTGHRRESFGEGLKNICLAIREIAKRHDEVQIIYPVHLNPNVQEPVYRLLSGLDNVFLVAPLEYPRMVWLLNKSFLVLTDSGGIQEEAPALGKPVLVMRDITERPEGIQTGAAILVGTDKQRIVYEVERMLEDEDRYREMQRTISPYGDGNASKRIVSILVNEWEKQEEQYL